MPTRERSADALVDRLFTAGVGMMDVISVYIGDRLGLYRALRDGGPAIGTSPQHVPHVKLQSFEGIVPKKTDWMTLGVAPEELQAPHTA